MKPGKTGKAAALLLSGLLLLTVSVSAAMSIEEQMAANSAAWWIAHNAGDTATCEALHAANEALAAELAAGGSANYDSKSGTWEVETSGGSKISSAGSSNGKTNTTTYTTVSSGGDLSSVSGTSYTDDSIGTYLNAGGTKSGLETSYNNAAETVTDEVVYGDSAVKESAMHEVAVAKALLGLTDAEAQQLQAELELQKQAFESARALYLEAYAAGDLEAAEQAHAEMDAAHEAAQQVRAGYSYTADAWGVDDGGYFGAGARSAAQSGNTDFYSTDLTVTYSIRAEAGTGGRIYPSGTVSVKQGDSASFRIEAEEGWRIAKVLVDGADKGTVTGWTFPEVQSAHTLTAVFEADGTVSIGTPELTSASGAALSGGAMKSGYGFGVNVPVTASGVSELRAELRWSFGGEEQSLVLQRAGSVYVLPVNPESRAGYRCVYVPVGTPDGVYDLKVTVTAKDASGAEVRAERTARLTVRGSMYEDDFTGDS